MSKRKSFYMTVVVLGISLTSAFLLPAQQPEKRDGQMTQKQMDEMNMRGDKHMGFDHLKTTHHFFLTNNGGAIQVEANDAKDIESRDQIRGHFRHIAMMFSEGNFEIPMLVHEKTPPGSEVMKRLKTEIIYQYKETDRGAVIQISTGNSEALQAIHNFLRFQIKEHMTGDPLEVKPDK
ncbi:MAG TPA: hypothetical protein VE863_08185 [Pyrinomonadaceae bacterium]|jgi:hypothetical protein|nr:hypothetical protein [Pyrinomonadaceae bacterium]